ALAGGDDVEVDVAPGVQFHLARALDGGARKVHVAPGGGNQAALGAGDVQARDAVDDGGFEVDSAGGARARQGADAAGAAARGGDDVQVAPGVRMQAVLGIDAAADDGDVVARRDVDLGAGDAPAEHVDVLGTDAHGAPPGDGAAVDEVAGERDVHALAGQQRARAVDVAGAHAHVQLRHEHALGAAVGQDD